MRPQRYPGHALRGVKSRPRIGQYRVSRRSSLFFLRCYRHPKMHAAEYNHVPEDKTAFFTFQGGNRLNRSWSFVASDYQGLVPRVNCTA